MRLLPPAQVLILHRKLDSLRGRTLIPFCLPYLCNSLPPPSRLLICMYHRVADIAHTWGLPASR